MAIKFSGGAFTLVLRLYVEHNNFTRDLTQIFIHRAEKETYTSSL